MCEIVAFVVVRLYGISVHKTIFKWGMMWVYKKKGTVHEKYTIQEWESFSASQNVESTAH